MVKQKTIFTIKRNTFDICVQREKKNMANRNLIFGWIQVVNTFEKQLV